MRWLHIYLSLFGFATLIFFSLTGITLNVVIRNGMLASLLVFLAAAFALQPLLGNAGLWVALHVWFLARAGFYWWALEQRRAALFTAEAGL